jgi:CubicO group peptidase (beta-lactamase class C family)
MTDTGIVEAQSVGSRRYGGPVNVTNTDRFYLGSCGKSFTAVLLGLLVDEGKLNWTTTLSTVWPEYTGSMRAEYRDVTVRDLLSHGAGFIRDPDVSLQSSTPKDQRAEVVAWAVTQPPVRQRGQSLYSNLGFIIAGAIAEKLTGQPYEQLVMERIVKPLGLTTAGIGTTGTQGLEDQPLQHTPNHSPIIAAPDARLQPIYNPAGGLYMSVGDWGRYCQWVLACEAGHQNLLRPETARTITSTAVSIGDGEGNALGWGIEYRDWAGGKVLCHAGSNGYNYAEVALAPARRFGIIVMSNQGAGLVANPIDPAVGRLIDYYQNGR